ncbi:hypothetical protein M0812_28940 [Anaeramoeba flamelloides]|uniref:P-loop containing nucleoside triphosphate hydrolase n=1 Tax=Anaeramoeba flamelloides TaxID=1746091 RepID=A0AAV7YCZ4_9EUKA|nr:hypothetical protein M0812_28940 [Anaeramoeba flamelloides]
MEERMKKLDQERDEMINVRKHMEEERKQMEARRTKLENELDEMKNELKEMKEDIIIKDKDLQIEKQNEQIEKQNEQIDKQNKQIKEQNQQIKEQNVQIDKQNVLIKQQNVQIKEQNQQIDKKDERIDKQFERVNVQALTKKTKGISIGKVSQKQNPRQEQKTQENSLRNLKSFCYVHEKKQLSKLANYFSNLFELPKVEKFKKNLFDPMKKSQEEIENKQKKEKKIEQSFSKVIRPIQTGFKNLTSCLFSHSKENPSQETKEIFNTFQDNNDNEMIKLIFLCGASGVGKTWTLVDYAFRKYSLFFNFYVHSQDMYQDSNMRILIEDIYQIYSDSKLIDIRDWHETKLLEACKRVEIDIISRLLALIIFLIQEEEEEEEEE